MAAALAVTLLIGVPILAARHRWRLLCPACACGVRETALDNLVELASIEPNTPALRAVVDFDALPLAHEQINAADGALETDWCRYIGHVSIPWVEECL